MFKILLSKMVSTKFWIPFMILLTLLCIVSIPLLLGLLIFGLIAISEVLKILIIEIMILYMSFGIFLCLYLINMLLDSIEKGDLL